MRQTLNITLITGVCLLFTGAVQAGLVEGFEGDPLGFPPVGHTSVGNVTVATGPGFTGAGAGFAATQGTQFAYLTTGPGTGLSGENRDGANGAEYDVAILSIDFLGTVGAILSFDYDVLTSETTGGLRDIFQVTLNGTSLLAGDIATDDLFASNGPFPDVTGFSTFLINGPDGSIFDDGGLGWDSLSTVLGYTGLHMLEFYVGDVEDSGGDTALLVDNIALESDNLPTIPAPAALLLLGSGLVGLAGVRRRLLG